MSLLDTASGCSNGTMGLSFGLQLSAITPKLKNRWMFNIPPYCAVSGSVTALAPKKSARPSIQMKEFEFQHLSESIWYPLKAEWKPISVVLYDQRCNNNAIFEWLQTIYDPSISNITFQ